MKDKVKKAKKEIILENLNHYRDFISKEDITKIIYKLLEKFIGVINIGSGRPVFLKDIAKLILNKYKKRYIY